MASSRPACTDSFPGAQPQSQKNLCTPGFPVICLCGNETNIQFLLCIIYIFIPINLITQFVISQEGFAYISAACPQVKGKVFYVSPDLFLFVSLSSVEDLPPLPHTPSRGFGPPHGSPRTCSPSSPKAPSFPKSHPIRRAACELLDGCEFLSGMGAPRGVWRVWGSSNPGDLGSLWREVRGRAWELPHHLLE